MEGGRFLFLIIKLNRKGYKYFYILLIGSSFVIIILKNLMLF